MARRDNTGQAQNLMTEISTLDSRIRVMAQRMKVIEKNEQILGKTLISHNKVLKELEKGTAKGSSKEIMELQREIVQLKQSLGELSKPSGKGTSSDKSITKLREDVAEMKYVLDTVNPIAYVTVDQVSDLINDKLRKLKNSK